MTFDFTKLQVEVAFGEFLSFNVAHDLGNMVHQYTTDIGIDDTARSIYYSEGPVEIPDEQLPEIRRIVEESPFKAFCKRAILSLLSQQPSTNN